MYNTQTAPSSLGPVTCGRILAVWEGIADTGSIDGFHIYNETTKTVVEVSDPRATRFEFIPITPTSVYVYSVTAFKGASESGHTPAGSIAATWPCDPVISGSNKDIIKVRDVTLKSDPYKDSDAQIKPAVPIVDGDNITFAVNVLNSGHEDFTDPITVVDRMLGLSVPRNGWQASVYCNNKCSSSEPLYDKGASSLTFVLRPNTGQGLAPGEVWIISFTAKTIAPENNNTRIYRFQNRAFINGFTSKLLATPFIPVIRDLSVPYYYEVQ